MYSVLMHLLYLTVELTSCPRAKTTCVCLELMDEKSSLKVVHLCYDPWIVSLSLHLPSCLSMVLVHCHSQPLGNLRLVAQLHWLGGLYLGYTSVRCQHMYVLVGPQPKIKTWSSHGIVIGKLKSRWRRAYQEISNLRALDRN